jgi:hypothetical protein
MTHRVDAILTGVRALLGAGLTVGGTALTPTRFPETPPLGLEADASLYPMVCLEPSGEERRPDWEGGKDPTLRFELALHFVAHRDNITAHPTISSPYEYVRKGAAAVDTVLTAAGARWGLTGVVNTEWQASSPNEAATDPEQGLWVYSTTWEVTYAG